MSGQGTHVSLEASLWEVGWLTKYQRTLERLENHDDLIYLSGRFQGEILLDRKYIMVSSTEVK